MPSGISGLRLYQWGLEGTRGTAVPATSRIVCEGIEFTPLDTVVRPPTAKGLLVRHPGDEQVVMRGTTFRVAESMVVYNQFQHWLGMAIKGGVTATGAGSTKTWSFIHDLDDDPAPDTRTLEQRLDDGTTQLDYEWAFAFLTQLRLIYSPDAQLRFSAEGVARRRQDSTLTASQAMPTINPQPAALAGCWIDAAWNNLGTTQVSAQVLSFDWTLNTGLKSKMTLDGRADLDFSTYVFDPSEYGYDATLRMLVQPGGQFATEIAAAEAQTVRAIRLRVPTSGNSLYLDMLAKYEQGSIQTIGSEDGQDIVEMSLVDATDGTNQLDIELLNTTTSTD